MCNLSILIQEFGRAGSGNSMVGFLLVNESKDDQRLAFWTKNCSKGGRTDTSPNDSVMVLDLLFILQRVYERGNRQEVWRRPVGLAVCRRMFFPLAISKTKEKEGGKKKYKLDGYEVAIKIHSHCPKFKNLWTKLKYIPLVHRILDLKVQMGGG